MLEVVLHVPVFYATSARRQASSKECVEGKLPASRNIVRLGEIARLEEARLEEARLEEARLEETRREENHLEGKLRPLERNPTTARRKASPKEVRRRKATSHRKTSLAPKNFARLEEPRLEGPLSPRRKPARFVKLPHFNGPHSLRRPPKFGGSQAARDRMRLPPQRTR